MQVNVNNVMVETQPPNHCPHCHKSITPILFEDRRGIGLGNQETLYTIWQCPDDQCKSMFSVVYQFPGGFNYNLIFLDGQPKMPLWPDTILKISSNFIETYKQSLKAEQLNLGEIAGMGYRKAIEYLVKDYIIHIEPSSAEKVKKDFLGKIISENFNDVREADLKELLQRATWLGNDMTHYLKYHQNFDISDLKELIKLVADEIHSIEQKRHYIQNIESKYKK